MFLPQSEKGTIIRIEKPICKSKAILINVKCPV